MKANRNKVPSNPTTISLGFNTLLMNTETLFKISGRPNILTFAINALYQIITCRITCKITSDVIFFTSNCTNKCTTKDHVVFKDVTRVTTSNTTAFFCPGNWKKSDYLQLLKIFFSFRQQ